MLFCVLNSFSFLSRYNVQASFKISQSNNWDVMDLAASEVRIIVLHCTQGEASLILGAAEKAGLTSHKYLWLVTQSVIGDPTDRSINRRALPLGMLGKWTKYSTHINVLGGGNVINFT